VLHGAEKLYKDLDLKIIAELKKDGRASLRTIAKRLGTSTTTVAIRIREMEASKLIRGFRPLLDYRQLGFGITAVTLIKAVGGKIPELMKDLMQDPQLTHVYEITGEFDLLVIAKYKDTESMNREIKKLLSHKAIKETNTSIVLGTAKEEI
jgi:DNA-binding Lrp family transcriptional regulator